MQFGRTEERIRLHDNSKEFSRNNVPLKSVHADANGGEDAHVLSRLTELRISTRLSLTPEAHASIGFTNLLDLHYWFEHCGLNRQRLGAPELVREEAFVLQGLAYA